MKKSKYKDLYEWIDKNMKGFSYGYVRNYYGFLRLTIFKNEFRWNLSNFDIDGLKKQMLEIL